MIAALAELGLEGWRGQLPFQIADIWVRIDEQRALYVSALPRDRDPGLFVAVSTHTVRGVQVGKGDPQEGVGDQFQFGCADRVYWVAGDAPPPFADLDALIDAFLGVLDCPAAG